MGVDKILYYKYYQGDVGWTSAQARKQLDAWQMSGMSMAAFCRERGIQVRRLYNWRSRLGKWIDSERNKRTDQDYKSNWNLESYSDRKSMRWVEAKITCADRERISNPVMTIRLLGGQRIDILDPERIEVSWLIQLSHGLSNQASR